MKGPGTVTRLKIGHNLAAAGVAAVSPAELEGRNFGSLAVERYAGFRSQTLGIRRTGS